MNVDVKWTGAYPNLCSGRWIITIDDKVLAIPEALINSSMNTLKSYETWHFDDWQEVWETYTDGIEMDEWIHNNRGWLYASLKSIGKEKEITYKDLKILYEKINDADWRFNSCGGCI